MLSFPGSGAEVDLCAWFSLLASPTPTPTCILPPTLAIFRPARWHKAKKVQLTPGQTEVKIDLPLPIVASNLMIEFADFYENYQASTETLQCPRCSASVPANPGVCGNCGENVYQCHKCRWVSLASPLPPRELQDGGRGDLG